MRLWKSKSLILVLSLVLASGANAAWPDLKKAAAEAAKVFTGSKTEEEAAAAQKDEAPEEVTEQEAEQSSADNSDPDKAGRAARADATAAQPVAADKAAVPDPSDDARAAEAAATEAAEAEAAAAAKKDSIDSQVAALAIEQELIVGQYVVATLQLAEAQILLALALGLEDQAALVRAEADALAADNSVDDKDLKRNAKLSESTSKVVRKKIKRGKEISVEGKQQYARGMLQYAVGLEESKGVMDNVEPFYDKTLVLAAQTADTARGINMNNWLERTTTLLSGGTQIAKKFKTAAFLVKESDDFALLHKDTLTAVIEFAHSNDIAIPEEATAALDFI